MQVGELLLELLAVRRQHDEKLFQLRLRVARRLVHVDEFLHLGEGQAEPLAAQRELQAGAVARGVDAVAAAALRRDQAAVFVEADRPRGEVELARELADREGGACTRWRGARRVSDSRFGHGQVDWLQLTFT